MEQTDDIFEHMLSVALCADSPPAPSAFDPDSSGLNPGKRFGMLRPMSSEIQPRVPARAYAHYENLNSDRLLTTAPELLMTHPAEIIGDGREVMLLDERGAQWTRLEPARKKPKGLATTGRAYYWAEMHVRVIEANGAQFYNSTLVPFSKDGAPLAAQWRGSWVCKPLNIGKDAIQTCSFIEDAQRPNAILASVQDGVELTFPISEEGYLEAFAMRDAPVSAQGRRRALLHWVAKHMRRANKNPVEVKRHMRGIHEFDMGGFKVRLHSADSDAPDRAKWSKPIVSSREMPAYNAGRADHKIENRMAEGGKRF